MSSTETITMVRHDTRDDGTPGVEVTTYTRNGGEVRAVARRRWP